MTHSLVRPIGATRTSFVTSSPSEVFKVTVVRYSRGNVLSIENGMRTDFPAMPNVGESRLSNSTSGSRDELPTGTVNTGMSFNRRADAASTGAAPSFQSPSEANTTARKFLNRCSAVASGSCRLLPRVATLFASVVLSLRESVSPSSPRPGPGTAASVVGRGAGGEGFFSSFFSGPIEENG